MCQNEWQLTGDSGMLSIVSSGIVKHDGGEFLVKFPCIIAPQLKLDLKIRWVVNQASENMLFFVFDSLKFCWNNSTLKSQFHVSVILFDSQIPFHSQQYLSSIVGQYAKWRFNCQDGLSVQFNRLSRDFFQLRL